MNLDTTSEPTYDLRDPDDFERAYRDHRSRAYAAALGVLRDPAAAEDVVQDVFAQLWNRPRTFDASRGRLRSYVTLLARNRAIDRWRSGTARDAAVDRLAGRIGRDMPVAPSAAERAISREESAEVISIIDRLPAPQREAILLAYGQDLTAREIGEAVGIPLGTAKSRVRRGLERLRETVDEVA